MADTYKAIFTCPEYDERVVWYVSSRHQAEVEFKHHKNGNAYRKRRYQEADYTEEVKPVFKDNRDASYDVSPFGYGA